MTSFKAYDDCILRDSEIPIPSRIVYDMRIECEENVNIHIFEHTREFRVCHLNSISHSF